MVSISFRKHRDTKEKMNLFTLIMKMKILFAPAIITSTAHASSVFLLSYRNMVLNQSACVVALAIKLHPLGNPLYEATGIIFITPTPLG